ncbi:IS256 family transposase [Mycobacteroides abscessus]|uniref:IS256 family transposase n=1 Tax=Mycobacteroides abscessus TaxID=36809 RepID=UPI003F6DD674
MKLLTRVVARAQLEQVVLLEREMNALIDLVDGFYDVLGSETALEEELADHLGYDKHDPAGRNRGSSRNGRRTKTVLTDTVGEIEIEVPRDRDGSFEPQIVKKHQRRLTRVDEIVLSLYAKGLTTGEIAAHFDDLYEAKISQDTISRITDKIIGDMADWVARPLERIYAAIFIDALSVKVRDGQVANRPFYAAIGVDLAGNKDVLGLWAGDGNGESAKFWFAVLKNRGVTDVFFLICDGLKGLPEVVGEVWPETIVQACVIHLLRNSFRYLPRQHWDALKRDLQPIYTAPTASAAETALEALNEKWGGRYPAMIRMWRSCWAEFIPFLDYDTEIRRVLCSTHAIESLNARYRRAIKARGHFPSEQAALKCRYLVTRSLDPKGTGQTRWVVRWKPALNAFAVTFANRMPDLNRG